MRIVSLATWLLLLMSTVAVAGCRETPAPDAAMRGDNRAADTADPVEPLDRAVEEVIANIRSQPVGDHLLEDHALPEPFLRRIADRILRDSFLENFYAVYDDGTPAGYPPFAPPPRDAGRGAELITVLEADRSARLVAKRRAQTEARPPRRGYRPDEDWGVDGAGASVVATRLARDGLLPTLAQVLERAGVEALTGDDAALLEWLRATGLPVDLLDHFALVEGRSPGPAIDVVRHVFARLRAGRSAASFAEELAALPFVFTPSHPGFRVASESGEHPLGLVRVQLTRGGYWLAPGDGGSVDVLRQLVTLLPDVSFVASVEQRFVEEFVPLAGAWPLGHRGRLTLAAEPITVAQWAQDNGKAGLVMPGRGWATIVPRYASRRDDGSLFVPGESSLADGLAAAGQVIVRSPLLFQGGNLLVARHPRTGERFLLIGEAEIWRNTALGLTREQVETAFRAEFAVDRSVVVESVSFHVDFDVSVRAVDDELVAFVNDPLAAAHIVLECGLEALRDHGVLSADNAAAAQGHVAAGRHRELAQLLGNTLAAHRDERGRFPSSLARALTVSATDSPVGNLHRFLLALDITVSANLTDDELPEPGAVRSYLAALRRIDQRRIALHETIRQLDWKVVPVPSLAAGERSLCAVNGIHDRSRYLMPAYGGLYAPLDAAAGAVFARHLGPGVDVVPVLCAESQRRSGAVHCAIAVYPAR